MTDDVFYSRNRAVLIDKINDTIRNSGLKKWLSLINILKR